jgi:hypothetical protein
MQLTIPQIDTNGRRLLYGIETTKEWLSNYLEKYRNDYAYQEDLSAMFQLYHAMGLLKLHTKIRNLDLQNVLPESTPIPPHPKGTLPTSPLPEGNKLVVVICSFYPESFDRRPSQARVDVLKKIMDGKEPKWWLDDEPF